MKRDLDFVRVILLYIEEHIDFLATNGNFNHPNEGEREFGYAMQLMREKCLINFTSTNDSEEPFWPYHHHVQITWEGHDFLDSVRDEEIWRKTKEGAKAAGGFTFDLVKALAKGFVKKNIEKHTGVELDI